MSLWTQQCIFLQSFVSIVCGFGPRRHVEVAEWCVLDGSSGKEGLLSSRLNIVLVDTCGLIACCQQQIIISSPMSKIPFSRLQYQNVWLGYVGMFSLIISGEMLKKSSDVSKLFLCQLDGSVIVI